MESRGVTIHRVTVDREPSPELIDETVRNFMGNEPGAVVSIGGGSVIDAGKAISAMLGTRRLSKGVPGSGREIGIIPERKYLSLQCLRHQAQEVRRQKTQLSQRLGKDGFKRSLRHDSLVPDIALIDPALTINCPKDITAAAGMDCFTQLTEAYLSTKSNEYTDALALEGIRAINRSLLRSYTHGDDINARSDMSFAALTSGICLANAGLGAVHGLAGTIGALYNVPHGVVCGTLMSAANELNVRELRKRGGDEAALVKYAVLGRIFADATGKSDSYYVDFFLDYLSAVTYRLDLPKLSKYGITPDDLPVISGQSDAKNNPVKLSGEQLTEILMNRL